jgi:hypothetical protein
MAISDYQISNVIRTYMDNLTTRGRAGSHRRQPYGHTDAGDLVYISEEGKRRLIEDTQRTVAEKTRKRAGTP